MVRYLLIMFVVMIAVIGAAWFRFFKNPMSFLDNSYANQRAKVDMATQLPPDSIVILGDSGPLVGMIPAEIGPDVYNLAFSGNSPIEVYAFARLVMAGPHPPRGRDYLSSRPFRCITDASFWEDSVRYRFLDRAAVDEIWERSHLYPNDLVMAQVSPDRHRPGLPDPAFRSQNAG